MAEIPGARYTWPMSTNVIIFLAVAGLVGAVAALQYYLKMKRRREVREEAARMGFVAIAETEWGAVKALPHSLFTHGHGRTVDNLIEGSADGMRARLFDYQYTTGSGKNSSTYSQTVAAFLLTQASLPVFRLRPEGFFHKLAEALGFKDIDFDGFPEFSENYHLSGADEEAVRRLFNPGVISLLGRDLGWTMEGQGATLLVYKPRVKVAPADFPDFLRRARQAAGAFRLR